MFPFESLCIGSSTAALVTYLLSKIRCICKEPCSSDTALCIYGSNDATFNHITDDEHEIIVVTAKKYKPHCF